MLIENAKSLRAPHISLCVRVCACARSIHYIICEWERLKRLYTQYMPNNATHPLPHNRLVLTSCILILFCQSENSLFFRWCYVFLRGRRKNANKHAGSLANTFGFKHFRCRGKNSRFVEEVYGKCLFTDWK